MCALGTGVSDGNNPGGGLVEDSHGNFYGTTTVGGTFNAGAAYVIRPDGTETLLHSFGGATGDGIHPNGALVLGSDGNLYGTTSNGGTYGGGTVFSLTPAGAETVLLSFGGAIYGGGTFLRGSTGLFPNGGLIQDSQGDFYGTTQAGGALPGGNGVPGGTVFRLTRDGFWTLLYTFSFGTADGSNPQAGLILGRDGNLYGTTSDGGTAQFGTVFRITPAGKETILYSFQGGIDGMSPVGALTLGSDGNFYGTTEGGGATGGGAVFRVTPTGDESVLYSFQDGSDAAFPMATLLEGSDGNLYGTSNSGGQNAGGTVFMVTPTGVETVLYSFSGFFGNDGNPTGALVLGSDGSLYGTTAAATTGAEGTVFRLTTAMSLSTSVGTPAQARTSRTRLH